MIGKRDFKILFLMFVPILFFACAKQVAVSGGPKDIIPPVMLESEPPNGSVNFKSKSIYIKFDEYVKLNNLNQKLIISPPIEKTPLVVIKKKGVKITLKPEQLEANTTYCFNFNDAIADNNENNALHSFVYAFSTGSMIDSLSFSGTVVDAFTKKTVDDAWVILHDVFADSAIKTYNPAYLTKVDKEGKFFIPFVRDNSYRIYALRDNNYNYLYDIPEEGIAFIDSVYQPKVETVETTDTTGKTKTIFKNHPSDIELILFTEKKQVQFIKSSKRLKPDYCEFTFNSTQYEEFNVNVIKDEAAIIYSVKNPDTVKIWLKNKELISSDNIEIFVNYRDPVYTDTLRIDTLIFGKPETSILDSLITISVNKIKEPHKKLQLLTNTPVDSINSENINLQLLSDSTFIAQKFTIIRDTLNPLNLIIKAKFLEKSDYRIIVEDGFAANNNGLINIEDTLKFSTSTSNEYGNLMVSFDNTEKNYIIQILKGDKIITEKHSLDGVVEFSYLKPASYIFRAIEDNNRNLRWDTGEFDKGIQPEPVYYYPSEYEIRANWNHELDWNPVVKK
ncbi:MAG: Ig-like domain-containing domain [Bacteroidales bacterium]|nr:Ig-like domain-containing domain [Bacteroidales bacterium]